MAISKLAHYSVRATDLDASRRFYEAVLDLRSGYRPPFEFPGVWLYAGADEADLGVVHLIGANEAGSLRAYLGDRGATAGGGAVDHVAFLASDWPALRARCRAHGVAYAKRRVPTLGLLQVFLEDPSGVIVELNFPAAEAET
jgi:catechol 2,3-dioxygenase-like lactoylglutathione lyase family enzyme